MTAVDVCVKASPAAANDSKSGEFSCAACGEAFGTALEHRAHFKSERHVYNSKRKLASLRPISQEAWERKLRESRNGAAELKGTAHLKAGKAARKVSTADSQLPTGGSADAPAADTPASEDAAAPEPSAPLSPRQCLFDRKHFQSIELNLAYMEKTYSFFIPDVEYCNSVPDLLTHLHQKVSEAPFSCINCNRRFPDAQSVRRHMLDKGHTQIASEVHTRRGNYDEDMTNEMQEEFEPFYDFHSSMKEVSQKITKPQQKVASILRFFDTDKDQKLSAGEVASLWAAANDDAKLSEAQYEGACGLVDADPKDGLDVEALAKLYATGFADLDVHFSMLQDLLIRAKKKPLKAVQENDDEDEEDAEGGEDDEDGDEEGDEEEDPDADEIVECEDEDEFDEVMRVLGLQPVTILPSGDLRLPNGSMAAHRDVAYIYRQRGVRGAESALALAGGAKRPQRRAQLMLSNSGAGCLKIAMSQRQEAREGKRIIAILRERSTFDMRVGMKHNTVNRARPNIRTGRGDCSNGR